MTPERLKAARAALGLTQAEFAEAFQVSPRAIGGW
jgi:transcriptional regulator with XRE-family HTH domain